MGGNAQFQVDGADVAEPGSSPGAGPDSFAFKVWAALGDILEIDGNMTGDFLTTYEGDLDTVNSANSRQQILINGGNVQVKLK